MQKKIWYYAWDMGHGFWRVKQNNPHEYHALIIQGDCWLDLLSKLTSLNPDANFKVFFQATLDRLGLPIFQTGEIGEPIRIYPSIEQLKEIASA